MYAYDAKYVHVYISRWLLYVFSVPASGYFASPYVKRYNVVCSLSTNT